MGSVLAFFIAALIGSQAFASTLKCTLRVNERSETSKGTVVYSEEVVDGLIRRDARAQIYLQNPLKLDGYSCEAAVSKGSIGNENLKGDFQVHLFRAEPKKRLASSRSEIPTQGALSEALASVSGSIENGDQLSCTCRVE